MILYSHSEELKEEDDENQADNTAPSECESPISPISKDLLNDLRQSKRSDSLPNLQESCTNKEILSNSYNGSGELNICKISVQKSLEHQQKHYLE